MPLSLFELLDEHGDADTTLAIAAGLRRTLALVHHRICEGSNHYRRRDRQET
jgi:hypothetical protein